MKLDLKKLYALGYDDFNENTPQESRKGNADNKTLPKEEKPAETQIEGDSGVIRLQREADKAKDDRERAIDAYKAYQRNIISSEQLQCEILKGVKAGENVYSLFLKAAKAISLMTSNTVFYKQIEADIEAIYGRGLQEKPPLQKELQDTQKRLQRLLEAEQMEQPPNSRERIHRAIEAHRKTIAGLENMIAETGEAD